MRHSTFKLNEYNIKLLKRDAHTIAQSKKISHSQALDTLAIPLGYRNWSMLMTHAKKAGIFIVKSFRRTPKSATVQVSPPTTKIVWLTMTNIAKRFGLTTPAVRKKLIESGYLKYDKFPTDKAFSNKVVQSKTMLDRFRQPTATITYYQWDASLASALFPPADEIDVFCRISNRHQATSKMEQTFSRAGKILGIEYTRRSKKEAKSLGLNPREYDACIQASHHDMHFLGDPLAFLSASNVYDVLDIWKRIKPLYESIGKKLKEINLYEGVFFQSACLALISWLWKQRFR